MSAERFQKAARDGILETLKEATKKDCNTRDEDGMTPTLWAAFEGNLDALRLLVGRGGNVDKADNFGNSALHFAAARGHMNCVTFLANFGANLWSLDIDFHTPKELAAMNNRDEILRFLDGVAAKEEANNKKGVKSMKEKAQKEADKRAKQYDKLQKKADQTAKEEQMRILKSRKKMDTTDNLNDSNMPHRPTTILTAIKIKAMGKGGTLVPGGTVSKRYSEIVSGVNPTITGGTTISGGKKMGGFGVQKKVNQKKAQANNDGDFKIGEMEMDGKRSLRSLTGLRRDSEILYVGSYDTQGAGKRGKITDVFDTNGELSRSISEPEFLHNPDSGFGDEVLLHEPASIFDRPGFGSVVFRNSITATLIGLPKVDREDKDSTVTSRVGSGNEDCSIGSAGSLAHRNGALPWDDEDLQSDEDDDSGNTEWSPLQLFLVASGLGEFVGHFTGEQIDLEALMLLTDQDLAQLSIPLGPRRKLTTAIAKRKATLEEPGEVADSRL